MFDLFNTDDTARHTIAMLAIIISTNLKDVKNYIHLPYYMVEERKFFVYWETSTTDHMTYVFLCRIFTPF